MPQEFQVLKCCDCETYQVQIVKKLNKWNCKMCGVKQSTRQVFMKSSKAADCRSCVQKINSKKGQEKEKQMLVEPAGDQEVNLGLNPAPENENEDDLPDVPLPSPQLEEEPAAEETPDKASQEEKLPPGKKKSKWDVFLKYKE